METFLTVLHLAAAILMIVVIIVQGGNSGGIGAAFGGGNSQGVFGAAGAQNFLGKMTYYIAAVFMVSSIWLARIQGTSGQTGLIDKLEQVETESTNSGTPEPKPE